MSTIIYIITVIALYDLFYFLPLRVSAGADLMAWRILASRTLTLGTLSSLLTATLFILFVPMPLNRASISSSSRISFRFRFPLDLASWETVDGESTSGTGYGLGWAGCTAFAAVVIWGFFPCVAFHWSGLCRNNGKRRFRKKYRPKWDATRNCSWGINERAIFS